MRPGREAQPPFPTPPPPTTSPAASTATAYPRAARCFHRPCLGTHEFVADFALVPEGAPLPESGFPPDQRDRDLGWMLHDIDHAAGNTSRFFRARLTDGVLDVQRCLAKGSVE